MLRGWTRSTSHTHTRRGEGGEKRGGDGRRRKLERGNEE
jgi:hypothetical protein